MQALDTSDYMGTRAWESMVATSVPAKDTEDESYGFPQVVLKKRSIGGSGLASGATTPGTRNRRSLSERDLKEANDALDQR
jgi:hypothetical protein